MIPALRQRFNDSFSEQAYRLYLQDLEGLYPGQLEFRIAETPLFIPRWFTDQMLETCEAIINIITTSDYILKSARAIPQQLYVPNEDTHPQFIAFDFGICEGDDGRLEPKLIELQAFPTLFAWHAIVPEVFSKHFSSPDNFSPYLNGLDRQTYLHLLSKIIVGEENLEQVVLLELHPHQQKTRVDFYATEQILGIKTLCLTEVIKEGNYLYYISEGTKIRIRRIYNRVIFDELLQQPQEVREKARFLHEEVDVTWVPHPNWFYRISKFTLPFIQHRHVPETRFLNEVETSSLRLQDFVVKPLFSFAGQGVIIDVTNEAIDNIADPENWIIQKKVNYAPAISTPDGPAKAEIRLFYFWENSSSRPVATNNLARLSKGKMIGVRYNQDRNWVGGSFCLFEQ